MPRPQLTLGRPGSEYTIATPLRRDELFGKIVEAFVGDGVWALSATTVARPDAGTAPRLRANGLWMPGAGVRGRRISARRAQTCA